MSLKARQTVLAHDDSSFRRQLLGVNKSCAMLDDDMPPEERRPAMESGQASRGTLFGAGGGNRTPDLRITNPLLCLLSYTGIFSIEDLGVFAW